jgi:hypothetical protein
MLLFESSIKAFSFSTVLFEQRQALPMNTLAGGVEIMYAAKSIERIGTLATVATETESSHHCDIIF